MRPIIVLALLGLYCVHVYGQGSGEVVVITPTGNSGISTDGMSDYSGSGDDEETSGEKPTVIRQSSGKPTVGDDEDEIQGSGSGGGRGFTTPSTGTVITPSKHTDNTDIFISEGTTEVTTKMPKTEATTKATTEATSTTQATTEKNIMPINNVDTTPKVATTPSTEVKTTSERPTTPVTTKKTETTSVGSTKERKRLTTPRESTTYPVREESSTTEFVKEMNPTTKIIEEPETTIPPQILAREGDPSEEGFTLTTEVIIGVVACAVLALLLIAFLMYRLKKRDEGSYLLDDTCGNPTAYKKGFADKEAFV